MFVDGILLSESTTVSVESDPQLQPIFTQQKGFAGVSPGAEQTKISVDSAVPRAGFEVDYLKRAQGVSVVELTFFAHSQKNTTRGFITSVKQSYGVSQAASVSFEFLGEPLATSTL